MQLVIFSLQTLVNDTKQLKTLANCCNLEDVLRTTEHEDESEDDNFESVSSATSKDTPLSDKEENVTSGGCDAVADVAPVPEPEIAYEDFSWDSLTTKKKSKKSRY